MYLHVLVSAVVVGWLSGVALAASGEGLRTEFGGTYANNTPTVGQTLRSDGTGYVPQDMTGITECPLAWDATTNQFECRDVDDSQLTEVYCRQNGTNCPSGLDVDTTLFVTPTGSGTVCSISEPCGSVQQCIQTAYTEGVGVNKKMICMLSPGTYLETEIRFTSDGTADGAPVTWLAIQGEGWKYTSVLSNDASKPVFIIERTNNVALYDFAIGFSVAANTVPPIVFNDAWKGVQLWGSTSTMTTQSKIPALHVRGGGATVWTKEFELFNLSLNEAGPLALFELSIRPSGTPGACTAGDKPGMCIVGADCGTDGICSRSSGDLFIDGGVLQSGAMGTHVKGGSYCDGGSTTLTGTGSITTSDDQLVGSGTSFLSEATAGNIITVNGEERSILSIESNTALTVSRNWTSTASSQTITHTDDGTYCTSDADCDGGNGTCYTGVCANNISIACNDSTQATDCAGLGGDTCAQGNSFSNIFLNQTYQLRGTEGGICPEDLNYCASNADCNACTTNADCDTNFSDGQCNGSNCICDPISFLVEGEFTDVTIRDETFDCLYQSGSCTPVKYDLAAINGSELLTCGVTTGAQAGNGTGSGGTITAQCMDLIKQTDFDPLSADPTNLNEGLCWWNDAENQMKCYDGTNDVEVIAVDETECINNQPISLDLSGNPGCGSVSAVDFGPQASDPASPTEGLCWWSDSENHLKCYDGTNDLGVVSVDEAQCGVSEPVIYDGSGNPGCGAISLGQGSLGITGTLTVGNGGTGGTSFTTNGVLYGQNLGALAVSNAGTDNQYLASNGGVPTFQTLDATDIGTGSVGLPYGGMGEAIGGDSPSGNKDCMFFYDGDQSAGEEMRFDCEATTQTNDYAWVFTGTEWGKLQASNNGDVLHKSSGDLVFAELTADSLNAGFGDFTCTGSAGGCTLDANSVSASAIQQIIGGDNELVCVGAANDWCIQHVTTRGADTGEVQDDTYFVGKLFAENDWQLQDLANADINQGYRNNNNQTEDGKISTSISPSANVTDSSLMEHIEVDYSLATLPMHAARRVAVAQTSSGTVNRNLVVYAAGTGTDSNATGVLVVDYLCTATLQGTTVGEYFVEKGAFAFQRNANGTFSGTPTQLYVDSHTSTASGYSFNVNASTAFGFAVFQAQDTTSGGAGTVSWVCALEEIFNAG